MYVKRFHCIENILPVSYADIPVSDTASMILYLIEYISETLWVLWIVS